MNRIFKHVYIDNADHRGWYFDYINETELKQKLIEGLNNGEILDGAYMSVTSNYGNRQSSKYIVWNKNRNTIKFVSENPNAPKPEYKIITGENILKTLQNMYQTLDEPVSKIGNNVYRLTVKDVDAKRFKNRLHEKHGIPKKNITIVKGHFAQWFEECQGLSMSCGVDYNSGWYSYINIKDLSELKIKVK